MCRLISLYGKCATKPGGNETWIRSTPLNVLIYECISAGVLDFDYAPVLTDVSFNGMTKKVWLNMSQEALTAVDELREHGLVRAVRMYTTDYKSMTAYQVSDIGMKMLKVVPKALFDELKHIVYVPDKENTYSDKVLISWNEDKNEFSIRCLAPLTLPAFSASEVLTASKHPTTLPCTPGRFQPFVTYSCAP